MSDRPAPPPVRNAEDVLADSAFSDENPERGNFAARFAFIGQALGTDKIGINLTIVPPGKKAWPKHYHFINDELFVVLEGMGVLHFGDADYPLRPLDVINIKAGTGIPFQIENNGSTDLRYLALSTLIPADVFHYTDSDKYGVMANGAPLHPIASAGLGRFARWIWPGMQVGYWEGEAEAGADGAVRTPKPD